MAYIDLKAYASVFPYVGPGPDVESYTEDALSTMVDVASLLAQAKQDLEDALANVPSTTPPSGDEWHRLVIKPPDVAKILDKVSKAVEKLNSVMGIVNAVLKVVELFINATGSWSKLISALIDQAQNQLNRLANSKAGFYMNLIVPPSFLKESQVKFPIADMASGGFQGFMERLRNSVDDPTDPHRPTYYNKGDTVGGFVILIDSETLDNVYTALTQLAKLFEFSNLFGITLSPPPPRNVRGYSGYFPNPKTGEYDFGISLDWDAPTTPAASFKVYRDINTGGTETEVEVAPTELGGKDGLIQTVKRMLSTYQTAWPKQKMRVYADSSFKPVEVKRNIRGGGSYIDFNMPGKKVATAATIGGIPLPYIFEPDVLNYYYVVTSKGVTEGKPSTECHVVCKTCDDTENNVKLIQHESGAHEVLSPDGSILQNRWFASIQTNLFLPYLPEAIALLSDLLENIKGGFGDSSSAFLDFVKDLKSKIENLVSIIIILQKLVAELTKFVVGPSAAFLWLPPEEGGIRNFLNRIQTAKLLEGQEEFSGPSGTSVGYVGVYGYSIVGLTAAEAAALKAIKGPETAALTKAWEAMVNLIT